MKKWWIVFIVLLLTAAAACGGSGASAPQANEEDEAAVLTQNEFWQLLEGTWVCVDEGENQYQFIDFQVDGNGYTFSYGFLASDYGEIGAVSGFEAVQGSATQYKLTVDFPEIEENELSGGIEAHSDGIIIDVANAEDSLAMGESFVAAMNEAAVESLEYVYYGADTYEASENVPGLY